MTWSPARPPAACTKTVQAAASCRTLDWLDRKTVFLTSIALLIAASVLSARGLVPGQRDDTRVPPL